MNRRGQIERNTKETKIRVNIDLDGKGQLQGATGIGFFDHMLDLLAKHSGFDVELNVQGDLHVDGHHTVEDIGIVMGEVLRQALGDKIGIERYGHIVLPMDEVLILVALDLSGRPYLSYDLELPYETIGNFETELVEEFFRALAFSAGMNLHIALLAEGNTHHMIEAAFKGLARALKMAVRIDERNGLPSTKGSI